MTEADLKAMYDRMHEIERKFHEVEQVRKLLEVAESDCSCVRVTLWMTGKDTKDYRSFEVPVACLPRLQKLLAVMVRELLPQVERELEAMKGP